MRSFFLCFLSTTHLSLQQKSTSTQNGGRNLSTIVTSITSNGIFIFLDVLFWIVFTCLTVYLYCTMPFPGASPYMYDPWCIPGYLPTGIYITLCWFSVLFETLAIIKNDKIWMIAVCILTAILFSLSVFISLVLSTTTLLDFSLSNNFMCGLVLAFFASIWNLARFSFQINLIRWIKSTNGHSIHTEETDYIPFLPQTFNGYQSI